MNTLDVWPAGRTATMDVDLDQANAAGGAIIVEVTPGAGNEFIVLAARGINSGTNTVLMETLTATGGTSILSHVNVASGAGTTYYLGIGVVSTTLTSGNTAGLGYPHIVSGTQTFRVRQTGAGAMGDNFRVLMNIRVKGGLPTVSKANSTNEADVTVAAGALSFTVI